MKLVLPDSPIFVVGAPRSGTSMMQWSLRQHPELWGGQESDYLVPLVEGARSAYESGIVRGKLHWLSGQQVSWGEYLEHIGVGINSLYTSRSGGRRWVEQSPIYTLHMDDIAGLFPDARFLYMLRDGRSVVHSLRHFVNPMGHKDATRTWVEYTRAALAFSASAQGESLLTVRYEDVVSEPSSQIRRIYEFLDLPFEAESVSFIESESPINSSFEGESSDQKIGPRWASWTAEERRSFDHDAGDLLVQMGYEPNKSWVGDES